MPISNNTFPRRLTQIDELTRPDHSWLGPDDQCFFLGEYTARKPADFSQTNQVVRNFKKSLDRQGRSDWHYKESTIISVARAFGAAINAAWLSSATLVPIPPSKCKTDSLYDDRIVRMLRAIPCATHLDIRELIVQPETRPAAHDANNTRPKPDDILSGYAMDYNLCQPPPTLIGLFDDVITTGAHYVAARRLISHQFPGATIVGFFLARRAPETVDPSDVFDQF